MYPCNSPPWIALATYFKGHTLYYMWLLHTPCCFTRQQDHHTAFGHILYGSMVLLGYHVLWSPAPSLYRSGFWNALPLTNKQGQKHMVWQEKWYFMCTYCVCSSSRFNTVVFLQTFFVFSFLKLCILRINRCLLHEEEMLEIFLKSVPTPNQCPTSDILFHLQPVHHFSI